MSLLETGKPTPEMTGTSFASSAPGEGLSRADILLEQEHEAIWHAHRSLLGNALNPDWNSENPCKYDLVSTTGDTSEISFTDSGDIVLRYMGREFSALNGEESCSFNLFRSADLPGKPEDCVEVSSLALMRLSIAHEIDHAMLALDRNARMGDKKLSGSEFTESFQRYLREVSYYCEGLAEAFSFSAVLKSHDDDPATLHCCAVHMGKKIALISLSNTSLKVDDVMEKVLTAYPKLNSERGTIKDIAERIIDDSDRLDSDYVKSMAPYALGFYEVIKRWGDNLQEAWKRSFPNRYFVDDDGW